MSSLGNRTDVKRWKRRAQRASELQLFEENVRALAHLSQLQDHNSTDESAVQRTETSDEENADLQNNGSFTPNDGRPEVNDASLHQFEDMDFFVDVSVSDNNQCEVEADDDVSVNGNIQCEVKADDADDEDASNHIQEEISYQFVDESSDQRSVVMDVESSNDCCSKDGSAAASMEPLNVFKLSCNDVAPEVWKIITGVVEERTPEEELKIKLALWAQKYNIQRNAVDELLHTLQEHGHPDLPSCAKTLLKTPRSTVGLVKIKAGGQFWYRGIKHGLLSCITKEYQSEHNDTAEIDVFIDGLSPYKSVKKNLWVIAGCLKDKETPFLIALWCGSTKDPGSVQEFFEDYVEEAADLLKNGFLYNGKTITFTIRRYTADAPARAWMRCVKPHNSYNSCERCTLQGEWKFRRITYNPAHKGILRTDKSFQDQSDKDHHVGNSPLLQLGTKMISQFPLDVMHMVYLGVTRRLFSLLLRKKAGKFKLRDQEISELDKLCVFLSLFCASDFARKLRPLSQWKLFKATEFRRLLLYDGFILHKSHKHKEVFECYLLLACAMRILLDSNLRQQYSSDAHELLSKFVKQSYCKLGSSFVVYNVHHLLHLTADCDIHGDPEDFSAFKYENHLGQLKTLLSAPGRTIQQIVCRVIEHSLSPCSFKAAAPSEPTVGRVHTRGPTLGLIGKQYTAVNVAGTVIRVAQETPRNSCVLMSSGEIVIAENFIECNKTVYVIGKQFLEMSDYFQFPIPSSLLGIFKVSNLGPSEKWEKEKIVRKVVYYPLDVKEDEFDCYNWREGKQALCIPLLHSEV